MIQRIIFFCLIAISGVLGKTQFTSAQNVMGARSIAAGQTGVSIPNNSWAVFSNSALLTTEHRQVSFYGFRYSGFTEITDFAASVTIPTGTNHSSAAGINSYGFDLFRETSIRAGYKYTFEHLHIGSTIHYTHVQQGGGYGSTGAIGADIGIAIVIAEKFWVGTRATNLNQPSFSTTSEELSRELAIGASYLPAERVMISTEIVKDVRFPLSFRAGAEAELIPGFFARTGTSTNPETYAAGFGYKASLWQINFGVQQHIPLGLSPAIDVGLQF